MFGAGEAGEDYSEEIPEVTSELKTPIIGFGFCCSEAGEEAEKGEL